jgi:hypothetical protein
MCRIFALFLAVVLFLVYIPAQAQLPGKLYLGASVGSSFIETKVGEVGSEQLKFNENGFAYKFYAGFKLMKFLGAEAGYRSLGTAKNVVQDVEFKTNVKGFDLFATGTLNLTMLDVFAKVGYFFWNSEVSGMDVTVKKDDKDFAWGVGAGLNLGTLGIRAEWERFNAGEMKNLSMLTAGITYVVM